MLPAALPGQKYLAAPVMMSLNLLNKQQMGDILLQEPLPALVLVLKKTST
jgi:hypothetical protein